MKYRYFKLLFASIVTFSIFYILFISIDMNAVFNTLITANQTYLWLALLFLPIQPFIQAKRWQLIIRSSQLYISLPKSIHVLAASYPVSLLSPSKSGDLIRAFYLKGQIPGSICIGTILVERLIDLIILFSLAMAGLSTLISDPIYLFMLFGGVAVGLIGLFFCQRWPILQNVIFKKFPKVFPKLSVKLNDMLTPLMRSIEREHFLPISFYSLLFWAVSFFQIELLFLAVGLHIPYLTVVMYIPLSILAGLLPFTISGLGTRDGAIVLLFAQYGEPASLLSIGILFFIYRYLLYILLGLPFMIFSPKQSSK